MKKYLTILLLSVMIVSCSEDNDSENNPDNHFTITELLTSQQWVFSDFEFISDASQPEDFESPFHGELGVDFTIEDVENKTAVQWRDFVISFNNNNTGSTMDFTTIWVDELYPMEWSIIGNNKIRIIYQVPDPYAPTSFRNVITILENVIVENNIFSYELEYSALLDVGLYSRYYGRYFYN